ncbi:MAG: D-aminoacyl-tRNA deacylase, partial [Ruminiclostridium sp.]
REFGIVTRTGIFQADMLLDISNNGPVTILLDSKKEF